MRLLTSCTRRHWGESWTAWDDDTRYYSDDPLGHGSTEAEAVEDLGRQLKEREEA